MEEYTVVGVSARHVHLTKRDIDTLFGKGYQIQKLKDLRQPGSYSSIETVSIVSSSFRYDNVRIVGPLKPYTQIEISKSDAYYLKINPPVRHSGDFEDTPGLTIMGSAGEITVNEGCIIQQRHIHIGTDDAKNIGVKNNQKVSVLIEGDKGGIFHDVYIKMADYYLRELHIDIDDANAFLLSPGDKAKIIL